MNIKLVADSSSNLFSLPGADYSCVPMKILSPTREYVDTPELELDEMLEDLKAARGPSGTSCPNFHEWAEAFEGADCGFAVTITSRLSGCCSAATHAAAERENICVLDSLSTGPEMQLILEKLRDDIAAGLDFESMKTRIRDYMTHTHLLFCLQSLRNLAQNGRVSHAAAKLAGALGLRMVGKASDEGTLELLHKARGEKKAISTVWEEMLRHGYQGGKVAISHCKNLPAAQALKTLVHDRFPGALVDILPCTALCSFYAEEGGFIVGYEDL